jgi:MoxR-like ATPase
MSVRNEINDLMTRVAKEIVGQSDIVQALIIGMLTNGNLLVEGLPGLAKTRAVRALASNLECDFSRIQFTPDITSPDITGREVYYKSQTNGEEQGMFKFEPGPIFANLVLADEINRAPPKSQNAMLEAMEERQVTAAGKSHKMPDLFMVMATMNPSTQQGTFAMPEAQMDRFLMKVYVDYPKEEAEVEIIRLIRQEQSQKSRQKSDAQKKAEKIKLPQQTIFDARSEIDIVTVPPEVERYIVDLIFATRYPARYTYELRSFIAPNGGASPRASLALDRTSRTAAWLDGRDVVTVDDVQKMAFPVLRHRIIRGERAVEHRVTPDEIIGEMLELVPAPGKEMKYKGKVK